MCSLTGYSLFENLRKETENRTARKEIVIMNVLITENHILIYHRKIFVFISWSKIQACGDGDWGENVLCFSFFFGRTSTRHEFNKITEFGST